MVSFEATPEEFQAMRAIAVRSRKVLTGENARYGDTAMDLSACHANGCPLDFEKLLAAPDFDFIHDVLGIRRHLDRATGNLMDCFVPRCAKPEKPTRVRRRPSRSKVSS